eukprot:g3071.t1
MAPQEIFVIRHGARLDHADARWADRAMRPQDSPLTEEGKRQASRLGRYLQQKKGVRKEDVMLYCSPFSRCVETANEIAKELCLGSACIRVEPALLEETKWMSRNGKCTMPWYLRAGDFSQLAGSKIDLDYEPMVNVRLSKGLTYPGRPVEGMEGGGDPESSTALAAFEKRCAVGAIEFFNRKEHDGMTLLLVGHGATMSSYVHNFDRTVKLSRYVPEATHPPANYTACSHLVLSKKKMEQNPAAAAVYDLVELNSIAHDPSIAKHGKHQKPLHIAVIGAGAAGLATCQRLLKDHSNITVTLLEAKECVGGRCSPNGAVWIHGHTPESPLSSLCEKLRIHIRPIAKHNPWLYPWTCPTLAIFSGAEKIADDRAAMAWQHYRRLMIELSSFCADDEVRATTLGARLSEGISQAAGVEHLDRRIMKTGVSILETWYGCSVDSLRGDELEGIDFEACSPCGDYRGYHCKVKGGMREVMCRFGEHLKMEYDSRLRILLNTPVSGVHAQSDGSQTVQPVSTEQEAIVADAVVCTVSAGVLQSGMLNISPPLNSAAQEAIQHLGMCQYVKILFGWDVPAHTRWSSSSTKSLDFALLLPEDSADGQSPALLFEMTDAPEHISCSIGGSAATCFGEAQTIVDRFCEAFPALRDFELSHLVVSVWDADPYAKGSYSFCRRNFDDDKDFAALASADREAYLER